MSHLFIYLHGFRSSPQSSKAQITLEAINNLKSAEDVVWYAPQLPPSPKQAIQEIEKKISQVAPIKLSIVGSSLGGYYATYLAEKYTDSVITVLNPGVEPEKILCDHVGINKNWHNDETFDFKSSYLTELEELSVPDLSNPQRYLLLAATEDEVIDYKDMISKYHACQIKLLEGEDHSITHYKQYVHLLINHHFSS